MVLNREVVEISSLWPEEATPAVAEGRGSMEEAGHTRRWPRLGPRRPVVAQPRTASASSRSVRRWWRSDDRWPGRARARDAGGEGEAAGSPHEEWRGVE